jgi:predicted nucleotidyltransferase
MGLFGSFVRDEQQKNSDIDLAIELTKDKKTLSNFFALKHELENKLGRKVDLGIETTLKPIVKKHIKNQIIYV